MLLRGKRQRRHRPDGSGAGSDIRTTLVNAGWRIDFLGPTTFVGNTSGFTGSFGELPEVILRQMSPGQAEQMRRIAERMATILPLIDDGRIHLPCHVVHATRLTGPGVT